jgi:tripartite-type tricarboxylate transporter receptor subunit TctC
MKKTRCLTIVLAAVATLAPAVAAAQDYPNRPIRLIVPFPPGGGTDLVSRTMHPALSERLGQQIVIDNRGGAQGLVGAAIAAAAAPDGYTLLVAEIGATAISPILATKLTFDMLRDFEPVTKLIEQPYIMSIHPSIPAKTLGEFIKFAQAKPGTLNYGSGNTTVHVAQEVFYRTANLRFQHIPYRGSGPSIAALVQNEVQVAFSGPGAAIPQIKAGRLRGLAVTTLKRTPQLPDIPTLNESGFKGFEISGWYGMVVPAKTPKPIIARLNADITHVLSTGETPKLLAARGYTPAPTSAEEFGRYMRSEIARWGKAVKEYGIKSID